MTTLTWYSLFRIHVASSFVCICWMSFVSHQESCRSLRRWIIVVGPPCHRSKDGCKRKAGVAGGYTFVGMNLYSPDIPGKSIGKMLVGRLYSFWIDPFSGNMLIFGEVIETLFLLENLVGPCKKTNLETLSSPLCNVIWTYRPWEYVENLHLCCVNKLIPCPGRNILDIVTDRQKGSRKCFMFFVAQNRWS